MPISYCAVSLARQKEAVNKLIYGSLEERERGKVELINEHFLPVFETPSEVNRGVGELLVKLRGSEVLLYKFMHLSKTFIR